MKNLLYPQALNEVNYRLKEGVRELYFKPNNFTNVKFPITWANIFVDCKKCNQSIGMKLEYDIDMGKISDHDAQELFKSYGWNINIDVSPKIILCPVCNSKE
jgi:hypothetical protein